MASSTSTSLASLPVRLLPLRLTPSGRPVLLPGEAERLIQDRADLVFAAAPTSSSGAAEEGRREDGSLPTGSLEDGVLRVTTHRLLWVDSRAAPSAGASCALPLGAVLGAELRATRPWSSAKTRVLVRVAAGGAAGALLLPSSPGSASSSAPSEPEALPREIKVVAPGQAAIHAALRASLDAREWEKSGGEGGGAAASPSQRGVDDAAVAAVVQMGFSASDAVAALRATGGDRSAGEDAQAAALWLLERGEEEKRGSGEGRAAGAPPAASAAAAAPAAAGVGVGGLLRREAASAAAADAALESAFSDLGALMRAAAEMVELAKKYRDEARAREERRRREEAEEGGGGGGGGQGSSEAEEAAGAAADFEDELALLGVIASPVTRASTAAGGGGGGGDAAARPSRFSLRGRKNADDASSSSSPPHRKVPLYIRELSAELSDFCQPLVAAAGGLLPLPDVYCLYNRARGAELAAPADVAAAAEAWEVLFGDRAPLRLRRLGEGGGVLAVAAAGQDDGAVCELLAALARGGGDGDQGAAAAADAAPALSSARARLPPAPLVPGLGRPLTPSDVAAAMRVPLPIAAAHLATAEAAGLLCRDDGDEGVRHFWNFFAAAAAASSSPLAGA